MKVDLLTLIKSLNNAKLVKIRVKPDTGGKRYLFLDYYKNGNRQYIYPGLFITMDPAKRKHDELVIRQISLQRDQYESRLLESGNLSIDKGSASFVDYAMALIADKRGYTYKGYITAINSFSAVYPGVRISAIDKDKASKYKSRIASLSACSVNHYVGAMRYICAAAVKDGILQHNPFDDMRVKMRNKRRDYLTIDEILLLISTPCTNANLKNAFLFSCFTGLRLGDIMSMKWDQIVDGCLYFTQSKTGSQERLLLPSIALDLLGDHGKGAVFHLPGYKQLRQYLKSWVLSAGISKHITFHCARHTFATLQLTLGTDIYTVSKLLGHSDVKVTQIYAKLVDQKRDDAMSRIDSIKKPLG